MRNLNSPMEMSDVRPEVENWGLTRNRIKYPSIAEMSLSAIVNLKSKSSQILYMHNKNGPK